MKYSMVPTAVIYENDTMKKRITVYKVVRDPAYPAFDQGFPDWWGDGGGGNLGGNLGGAGGVSNFTGAASANAGGGSNDCHPCDAATQQSATLTRGGRRYRSTFDAYQDNGKHKVCRVHKIDGPIIATSSVGSANARSQMRRTIFVAPFTAAGGAYDAGHLIADSLGGPNVVENLVPMLRAVNRSHGAWRDMEEWIESCLRQSGTEGIMSVQVSYNSSASSVKKYIPTHLEVEVLLSDSPSNSTIHRFSIPNKLSASFTSPGSCI